jgi:hypothetical protein
MFPYERELAEHGLNGAAMLNLAMIVSRLTARKA